MISIALFCVGSAAHAGDCPSANTPEQIRERLSRAQVAFQDLDIDAFTFAMEEVGLMIPCLDRQPEVGFAAELHRMQGVALYAGDQPVPASMALRAGKVLEPDFSFPVGMFPEGYALLDEWKKMETSEPTHARAPVPRKSKVSFDGRLTLKRPSDRSTLFQHIGLEGDVLHTAYLQPTDSLPVYTSVPRVRNRLIAATVVSGLLSGTFYKLCVDDVADFERADASLTRKEMVELRSRANTYYTLSGVFATLTATGVVGSVTIGHR